MITRCFLSFSPGYASLPGQTQRHLPLQDVPAAQDPRGPPEDDGQLQLLLDPDHEHRHRIEAAAAGRETEGCARRKQRLGELLSRDLGIPSRELADELAAEKISGNGV